MIRDLTVTDLKQYTYCPRVFFFMRCLPDIRPVTVKMTEGILAHDVAEAQEKRRQLHTYGFTQGERHFGVELHSPTLGLVARIDLIILRPDGRQEAIPVDYKLSERAGEHFHLQLAAYALLVEEEIDLPAPYGFLYLIPERRAERIALTPHLKRMAVATLAAMQAIVETETWPAPVSQIARCINCEFRRFCNDIA